MIDIHIARLVVNYVNDMQNTSITETQEFRERFWIEDRDQNYSALNKAKTPITCFRGQRNDPRWFDEESSASFQFQLFGGFQHLT